MTAQDVIRNAVPGASDSFCEFILWSRTPFPFGAIDAKTLYKSTMTYHRAYKNKIELCELCDNKVYKKGICKSHYDLLYDENEM